MDSNFPFGSIGAVEHAFRVLCIHNLYEWKAHWAGRVELLLAILKYIFIQISSAPKEEHVSLRPSFCY